MHPQSIVEGKYVHRFSSLTVEFVNYASMKVSLSASSESQNKLELWRNDQGPDFQVDKQIIRCSKPSGKNVPYNTKKSCWMGLSKHSRSWCAGNTIVRRHYPLKISIPTVENSCAAYITLNVHNSFVLWKATRSKVNRMKNYMFFLTWATKV